MSSNNAKIGDKLEDFELLTILGEGGSGIVLKVRSLINNEIYAMKIINLENKKNEIEYIKNEIEMLKKIEHQNIVKYYTKFEKDNRIYIIMEYLEYGNLDVYINLLTRLKKKKKDIIKIKKLEIINIFIQCINALKYLHESNIIHRDIKPENIFMSRKLGIKLGDFGVAAINNITGVNKSNYFKKNNCTMVGSKNYMAPEVYRGKKYDNKADIYSLGLIFYEIYFLKSYRTESWNFVDHKINCTFTTEEKQNDNKDPIVDFIFSMIEEDFNKRPDIMILSKQISEIYKQNLAEDNNSIYSVIKCLSNFYYVNHYFIEKYKKENHKNLKYSQYFYNFIINQNNWKETLAFFKKNFYEDNDSNFFDVNKEIEPYIFLNFILDKIDRELFNSKEKKEFKNNPEKEKFINEAISETNIKFKEDFANSFNYSNISNNFSCLMTTFYICLNCKNYFYHFSKYFCLSFRLNLYFAEKKNMNDNINIIDLFKFQKDITLTSKNCKLYCEQCKNEFLYEEKKFFYYLPFCLVINLDYNGVQNIYNINIPEKLDLSSVSVHLKKESAKKYNLVGIIRNKNGHYVSIIFDYTNTHKWLLINNHKKINMLQNYREYSEGRVEMLFYFAPDKK